MSVKPIIPSIEDNNNAQKVKQNAQQPQQVRYAKTMPMPKDSVSFTGAGAGFNPIVGLMDFMEQGGYAASFIIQDGIGFIAPRVGKGLYRGSLVTDENGQPVLDENGKQKRELNWALARKEFLREIITGPSAFLIPCAMFYGIKKWGGAANNVKLNYINGFESPFTEFAKTNAEIIKNGGELDRAGFYKNVYAEVIERSINSKLPEAERIPAEKISETAEKMAEKLMKVEDILANKELSKKAKKENIAAIGESVDDMYMRLRKSHLGGTVNELAVEFKDNKGKIKGGSISELGSAMGDYFSDALRSVKALGDNISAETIEQEVRNFTNRRMGTRVLTNLGIFSAVALFYTQIPKLYSIGQKGNPALKGTALNNANKKQEDTKGKVTQKDAIGKEVPFTGALSRPLQTIGEYAFSKPKIKNVSDIFEFNGNVISGAAMPVLLYGFCIPPRLWKAYKADDKYDFGEIMFRDMTSFTALLFGAKALARLFSDGFTKLTGLALNKKDFENRNIFQRVIDYLNPLDTHHSVLSSKQLVSKYTDIDQYKGGVNGFVQFIEESGGNIKKAFAQDKKVKAAVEEILKKFSTKTSYADANVTDIKDALKAAHDADDQTLIRKFYDLFSSKKSGFVRFMEENGDNIKEAFAKDNKIKVAVEEILKKFSTKTSYADAGVDDIREALKVAQNDADNTLINKLYSLFNNENKLLSKARTCNSTFGFVSTIILIPGLIMWIANKCEKMTKQRAEQDMAAIEVEKSKQAAKHLEKRGQLAGQVPTMAGFLGNNAG